MRCELCGDIHSVCVHLEEELKVQTQEMHLLQAFHKQMEPEVPKDGAARSMRLFEIKDQQQRFIQDLMAVWGMNRYG
jgi:hypothetical protein